MLLRSLLTGVHSQAVMRAEIIALRHQLIVLQRTQKTNRLVLGRADRCLWVWLSRLWSRWRSALIIVKPETVVGWHRQGFQWYWTWKIRHGRSGRPRVSKKTRDLIRTMSRDNPIWGAPRLHGELLKLGITISQASVAKYMVRHPMPPSQTWRTFLANHVSQLVSIDRSGSRFCSSPSCSHIIVDASSISMSRLIRRRRGPRSKSSKRFLSTAHRNISCETAIGFTETSFGNKWMR